MEFNFYFVSLFAILSNLFWFVLYCTWKAANNDLTRQNERLTKANMLLTEYKIKWFQTRSETAYDDE